MSEKSLTKILKIGIAAAFLSPLLVFDGLFFPYITSKQIFFDILIEVMAFFWIFLLVRYPDRRPNLSHLSQTLILYFAIVLVSCFTGVDFNLSFWGDVERMLGWFHLAHFLVFYLILITVVRTREEWVSVFRYSVIAALIVSLHGIGQRLEIIRSPWGPDRIIATIGNAAYVGAYAIFNVFFAFFLVLKEEKKLLKFFWLAASMPIILALIFSGTRGAYLGFGAGVIVFFSLFGFFAASRKIKYASAACALIIIVFGVLIFANAGGEFVKNNVFLSRMTHISLSDATMQTRLLSWRAAWLDFKRHPLFGTGNGNFAITFDRYFDPEFYNYTTSETYFDRAHNNLIDIASTTGSLGLAAYLLIFVWVFYYLFKEKKANRISGFEFSLFISLFVAYFIQNLAVFDSLVTYLSIFIALGWIDFVRGELGARNNEEIKSKSETAGYSAIILAAAVLLFSVVQFNLKPAVAFSQTISAKKLVNSGNFWLGAVEYEKALSHNTVLDRDLRSNFVQTLIASRNFIETVGEQGGNEEKAKMEKILEFAISGEEKNLGYNPKDGLLNVETGTLLNIIAVFYKNSPEKFWYYSKRAEEYVNKAIESSPGRVTLYYQKAQIYINREESEKVLAILNEAYALNPDYNESVCRLGQAYLFYGHEDKGYETMGECFDKSGAYFLSEDFLSVALDYFIKAGDEKRVGIIYNYFVYLIENDPLKGGDFSVWAKLANFYAGKKDYKKARFSAEKVGKFNPDYQESSKRFIDSLPKIGD